VSAPYLRRKVSQLCFCAHARVPNATTRMARSIGPLGNSTPSFIITTSTTLTTLISASKHKEGVGHHRGTHSHTLWAHFPVLSLRLQLSHLTSINILSLLFPRDSELCSCQCVWPRRSSDPRVMRFMEETTSTWIQLLRQR
jgi:hypothetical protein